MMIEQVVADALGSIISQPYSDTCIWVGLSAGVDSTVLFHAAAHYCAASGKKLKAIHVHHGLSDNADDWAKQARNLCEKLSKACAMEIECIVEQVQLDPSGDGIEQAARSARYHVFAKHCQSNDVLLQGHHLDDQIETFFMRAIRGSGLTGLASIPKQRSLSRENSCQILRPLIDIEKTDLLEYANQHQLCWVEDESNQDSKMDRNWWRNELLPQIWQRYPAQKLSLFRTINTLQHEQKLLQDLLQASLQNLITYAKSNKANGSINIHPALNAIPSFDLKMIEKLDQATSVSYLRAWLAQYVDILPSAIQMQTIYSDLILARSDRDPSFHWSSSSLFRYQNTVHLMDVDYCNNKYFDETDQRLVCGSMSDWHGQNLDCFCGHISCHERSDILGLVPAKYEVRRWRAGDIAKPHGRSTRKMKKWWQDYNVPSWMRECWPIIVNAQTNEIAAVPGLFVCQGYCTELGQPGWIVEYTLDL